MSTIYLPSSSSLLRRRRHEPQAFNILVAGRPGCGKTSLIQQIGLSIVNEFEGQKISLHRDKIDYPRVSPRSADSGGGEGGGGGGGKGRGEGRYISNFVNYFNPHDGISDTTENRSHLDSPFTMVKSSESSFLTEPSNVTQKHSTSRGNSNAIKFGRCNHKAYMAKVEDEQVLVSLWDSEGIEISSDQVGTPR